MTKKEEIILGLKGLCCKRNLSTLNKRHLTEAIDLIDNVREPLDELELKRLVYDVWNYFTQHPEDEPIDWKNPLHEIPNKILPRIIHYVCKKFGATKKLQVDEGKILNILRDEMSTKRSLNPEEMLKGFAHAIKTAIEEDNNSFLTK